MLMFLISLTYKVPLAELDRLMTSHIAFLDKYYAAGRFIFSGRKDPRTGGIILAHHCDRQEVEALIKEDPFYQNDAADYEIIEFIPTRYQEGFAQFLTGADERQA